MELEVGEERATVAGDAARLADEQLEAAGGGVVEARDHRGVSLAQPRHELIKGGVPGLDLALERCEGLADVDEDLRHRLLVLGGHGIPGALVRVPEATPEQVGVVPLTVSVRASVLVRELVGAVVGGDGACDGGEAQVVLKGGQRPEDLLVPPAEVGVIMDRVRHPGPGEGVLEGVLDGHEGLGPQAVCPAIPEEPALVREVPQGHGVPLEGEHAEGEASAVGEGLLGQVAGGAGDVAVLRERGRVEEQAPEGGRLRVDLHAVGGVLGRRWHR